MANKSRGLILLLLSIPALVFSAEISSGPREQFDPSAIRKVAFLPFARAMLGPGGRTECPLKGEVFIGGKMEDAAESELTRAVGRMIDEYQEGPEFISQADINAAREKLKKEGRLELTKYGPWQMAIGRELGADAVLFGFVYLYRDRVGGPYTASKPAAIALCLHLVDVKMGKVLWDFRYSDEQEALLDNLLDLPTFIKRKGRWVTAEDMSYEAAVVIEETLPWTKPGK